ncbi:MAG: putative peptide transporter substrate-binding protein, partial [Friedmanniella sp.]|nr:putative peptide transporter substrate-binding protein [Friedmanniella sp.]
MRGKTRAMAAAAVTTIALVASACGGGGSTTPAPGASSGGQAGGDIVIKGCTPQNELLPGNTAEVCGGNVLDAVFAKLVHYNSDTA